MFKCVNKFPKAIDLLKQSLERLELNNIEKSESEYINSIKIFLKSLEKE